MGTAFDYLVRASAWSFVLDNNLAAKVIHTQLLIRDNQWLKELWKNSKSKWPGTVPPDDTLIAYIEDTYRVGGK